MKERILELRKTGLKYREIAEQVGCNISTVSYHCCEKTRRKASERMKTYRQSDPSVILKAKSLGFKNRGLYYKSQSFRRRNSNGYRKTTEVFTVEDVLKKIGDNPICYLTGRSIDLSDSSSYNLDHIVPSKVIVDNSLDNLGITCRDANFAKTDMSVEEFVQLCKEVVKHNGYKIVPE